MVRAARMRSGALDEGTGPVGTPDRLQEPAPWWGVLTGQVLDQSLRARGRRPGTEWWAAAAGGAVALLGASPIPAVLGMAAVPIVRRLRRASDVREEHDRRAEAVIALCGALAGEVRAGRQPGEALTLVLRGQGGGVLDGALAPAVAAARFGGDVATALTGASRAPGAEGLRGLAACWRVAVDRGAGLADGLERLDAALRSERDRRADLRSQLAGARATTVMLAGLPVLGLLLGTAMGADPLRILLHTGAGLACLAVGGVLEAAGVWWASRIVRGAEAGA
ncbi:type II secretion system F family protein [Streptomyces fragilis]|uniref:Type II secretion system F family protein n=2 Tax=Streptomyces fragilis TaxID=67301 RepID=A0ABV2YHT7_9ACTN|nr:type II secretion system F family protein [Streptomyces fragilis]